MDAEKARYVMEHRARLTQDVSAVMPIVDSLGNRVYSELYTEILGEKTRQQQMRILYVQLLQPGTSTIRAEFYNAVKEHQPFLLEKNAVSREETMDCVSSEQDSTLQGTLEERIFDALSELTEKEFDDFCWWLRKRGPLEGLQPIQTDRLEKANKTRTADLIVQTYTNKGEKIMVNVLGKIKRFDLQGKFGSIP